MVCLDKLQPIGSVLTCGERRFVVVGHRMTREEDRVAAGYVVVPYPLGFVDASSLSVVPAGKAGDLVDQGFANEDGAAYLEQFCDLATASEGIAFEEYTSSMRLLGDFVREEGQHG